MKILVVGGGGREHALAWRLASSERVQKVFVAPGNGGTAADAALCNVAIAGNEALADFAVKEAIDLTVVGPEGPLAAGIVDEFRKRGLRILGPTRAAAQLESSKAFAKEFMLRHAIPTAAYACFSDAKQAHQYIDRKGVPLVVKADGLAAGKGVVVARDKETAHQAVHDFMVDLRLGSAGSRLVIEDCLEGEEASFIVIVDGEQVLPLATSQDHKRLRDGDEGPNTGGMGAISPAPVVTPEVHARVMREIIQPAVQGMIADGMPYTGFLYAGLMIDAAGRPYTLEFNCRLGDPETQPIMARVKGDFLAACEAAVNGNLADFVLEWDRRTALGVVMAARGYPQQPEIGDAIDGIAPASEDAIVFHAATSNDSGRLLTSGGRVLCVTALGDTVRIAQQRAYQIVEGIHFRGAQYRRDIGALAVNRKP